MGRNRGGREGIQSGEYRGMGEREVLEGKVLCIYARVREASQKVKLN